MTDKISGSLLDDLVKTMPSRDDFEGDDDWHAKAVAVISHIDPRSGVSIEHSIDLFNSTYMALTRDSEYKKISRLIRSLRYKHILKSESFTSTGFEKGKTFDYFDEIKSKIELAGSKIYFVDPYLDADFVKRYIPFVKDDVTVRLLTKNKSDQLISAVETYNSQRKLSIEIRKNKDIHDRYLFVDEKDVYMSSASFKDGAKNAPVLFIQVVDNAEDVYNTYDKLWDKSNLPL